MRTPQRVAQLSYHGCTIAVTTTQRSAVTLQQQLLVDVHELPLISNGERRWRVVDFDATRCCDAQVLAMLTYACPPVHLDWDGWSRPVHQHYANA